jgi:hypothetical protein
MAIEPIITLAIDRSYPLLIQEPSSPSYALQFFQMTGIQVMTVDGQVSPIAVIFLMFAVWGVWHWILMAINGGKNIKRFIDERKGF